MEKGKVQIEAIKKHVNVLCWKLLKVDRAIILPELVLLIHESAIPKYFLPVVLCGIIERK